MKDKDKVSYCAVFQFNSDGINIFFPDLQGCLSCAFSENQSKQMAAEALSLWLTGMKCSDLPTPTPEGAIICKQNEIVHTVNIQVRVHDGYIIGHTKED